MNIKTFLYRWLVLGVGIAPFASRATTQVVQVSGSIFGSTGAPLTGNRDVQIKAYDASSSGTLLWTSKIYNVTVTGGRFSLDLDTADTSISSPSLTEKLGALSSSASAWFEVHYDSGTAGNGVMNTDRTTQPRFRVRGTAFALSAASGTALAGVTATTLEINYLAGVTANLQTQLNGITVVPNMPWSTLTGDTTMVVNRGYVTNSASLITLTLPATAAVGDIVRVAGLGSGGWKIAQNAGQTIYWATGSTATGTSGYLQSVNSRAVATLACRTANDDWEVASSVGDFKNEVSLTGISTYTSSGIFVVPSGVTSVTAKVWGAGGGGGAASSNKVGAAGGGGAYAESTLSVTAGTTLTVTVGTGGSGGFYNASRGGGGGGGGYSMVSSNSLPLVVAAGGGGGGGGYSTTLDGNIGGAGGFATGLSGVTAGSGAGGGATLTTSGSYGAGSSSSNDAQPGLYLQGGGAYCASNCATGGTPGGGQGGYWTSGGGTGGGGGGYYGGGGAGGRSALGGPGGGGGASLGQTGAAGSGVSAGNNGDTDYAGSAGAGGAGGTTGNAGTSGTSGRVIIRY